MKIVLNLISLKKELFFELHISFFALRIQWHIHVFNKQTKFMSYCCLKSYEDLVIEWHPGWQRCIVWGIRHVKWWCGCVHKMLIFFVTRWYTWSNLKRWFNFFHICYSFNFRLRIERKYDVINKLTITAIFNQAITKYVDWYSTFYKPFLQIMK